MDYSLDPKITSFKPQPTGTSSPPNPTQRNYEFLRHIADDVQQKHTRKQGSRCDVNNDDDDELVKHMTNLPAYLQQMETGQDFQGKLLNFGVLDWKRLQKWNNNHEILPQTRYMSPSTVSTAAVQAQNYASQRRYPPPSNGLRPNSAHQHKQGAWSQGKVTKPRGFETAPWSNVDGKRNYHIKAKSSGEIFSEFDLDRGARRKESDKWNKSAKELLSLDRRKNTLSTSSHVTKSGQDSVINTMVNEEIDVPSQPCEHDSIVLLLPKSSPNRRGSKSIQLPKSRTSFDGNSGETPLNPGCLSPEEELHYLQLSSEIPHSCPLPGSVATNVESNVEPCSSISSLNVKLQLDASGLHRRPKEVPFIPSYSKCRALNSSRLESSTETPCRLDQGISAKQVTPGKHVSCSSNARMATNPILKEGLSIPGSESSYYTVKSGPLESGTSAGLDAFSRDNTSASHRATPKISTTPDPPSRVDQDTSEQAATMGMHTSPSLSIPRSESSYYTVKSGPLESGTSAGLDAFSRDNTRASHRATSKISTTPDPPSRVDQDTFEQAATMGMHTSPSRRFPFSRMTRSLSFKEGTSLPPLSSSSTKVKSGPISFEAFRGLDKFDQHNVTAGHSSLLSPTTKTETARTLDQDLPEQPGMVGRHSSPRRFSFSRMTRSFSFKEGSPVPRLSSSCATKSGSVGFEASGGLDKLNQDNLRVSNSARFGPLATTETPKRLDQDIAKQPDTVGRHTSPSRRFSFINRRKISKSLDFKEVSSGPQLSSYVKVNSHPATLDAFAGLDRFNQDSSSASNRARSSPLRRLLDPLLKPRGVLSSAETVKPLKENCTSVKLKPLSASELLRNQRHETSNVQALLQLTRKNGLPLFKLVVDNGSDVLVAAVKQLPTPVDNASSLIYTLYSVHERKNKNGSWMSQGFRGKRSSFAYNIIGQMKVFNSCPTGYGGENSKDQYVSRESVLYGVEMQHGNKETPELKPSKELAAIAIKKLYQEKNEGEQEINCKLCSHEGFTEHFLKHTCNGRETKDSDSTTVILGGVHGLPEKVLPSPSLICRYGGSCDCGGWDVGCKLQILTTQDQKRNSRASSSCSTGLDLFSEGGHQEKKPSFSLSPFKTGVYSVEFDSSISLLQSFFMSIAFLSSQKLHEIFEGMLDGRRFTQHNIDKMDFPIAIQGNIPAKYVTKPPPSPVGRV